MRASPATLAPMPRITLLILLLFTGPALAAPGLISAIRFKGNEITREAILRQELLLKPGDAARPEAVERDRRALMNLGLFKWVRSELRDDGAGGVELLFSMEEKFYFLPIPRLDAKTDGSFAYGMELSLDNVGGLNQRLKLVHRRHDAIDATEPQRIESELSYSYPRLLGTRYALSMGFTRTATEIIESDAAGAVTAEYDYQYHATSVGVSRWLGSDGTSSGWRLGTGMVHREQFFNHTFGTPGLYEGSQALGVTYSIGHYAVDNLRYRRIGHQYGVSGELGLPMLGSDHSYNRSQLFYRRYHPLDDDRPRNLNAQLRLGAANGLLFGNTAFSIGGSDSLRGHDSGALSGNAYLLLNLEYRHPLSGYPQLRGVLFSDIGNAWPGVMEMDITDLVSDVGIGLRWKVQSFVNMELTVDVGYDPLSGKHKVFAGSSGSF